MRSSDYIELTEILLEKNKEEIIPREPTVIAKPVSPEFKLDPEKVSNTLISAIKILSQAIYEVNTPPDIAQCFFWQTKTMYLKSALKNAQAAYTQYNLALIEYNKLPRDQIRATKMQVIEDFTKDLHQKTTFMANVLKNTPVQTNANSLQLSIMRL